MQLSICPHCDRDLLPREVKDGSCDACGEKLHAIARRGRSRDDWDRHEPHRQEADWRGDYRDEDAAEPRYRPRRRQRVRLATRTSRLVAKIFDVMFLAGSFVPGLIIFFAARDGRRKDADLELAGILTMMLCYVGIIIYEAVLLSAHGQTLGKRIMRIRVVNYHSGDNPGFLGAIVLRIFVPFVIEAVLGPLCIIFLLADICFIFGDERRCLHDMLAGTTVVEV
jgi:uncharacterized RDD family membrane protein YckC